MKKLNSKPDCHPSRIPLCTERTVLSNIHQHDCSIIIAATVRNWVLRNVLSWCRCTNLSKIMPYRQGIHHTRVPCIKFYLRTLHKQATTEQPCQTSAKKPVLQATISDCVLWVLWKSTCYYFSITSWGRYRGGGISLFIFLICIPCTLSGLQSIFWIQHCLAVQKSMSSWPQKVSLSWCVDNIEPAGTWTSMSSCQFHVCQIDVQMTFK